MTNLEKIRSLPEGKRKIIFWSVLVIIGLGLVLVYFINIKHNIRDFESVNLKEKLKLPDFGEEFQGLPELEISTTTQEELKKIEEEIQKNEEENQTSTLEQQATTTE
jgi:uncharacterized protein HemX